MKKILLLIIEINGLVFPWYVFMGVGIMAIDAVTGGFLARMSITHGTIYWVVGMSAALEIVRASVPRLKQMPKLLKTATVVRIGDFLTFILVGGSVLWASFRYEAAQGLAEAAARGGMPTHGAGIVLLATGLLGAFMNGAKSDRREDGTRQSAHGTAATIKDAYRTREESSIESSKNSAYPLWRYAHETEYAAIVRHVPHDAAVLDAGCGDGTLAILLARNGATVTACDISERNVEKARRHAEEAGVANRIQFVVADAEQLPFPDASFDWVVSSHVLEHVPDFGKGLAEIRRVTRKNAVIAMPTCLNPCAAVILGGDVFWTVSRWSPVAWFIGLGKIVSNIGGIGVDEGYRGEHSLPHIWRYPHVMRRELRRGGFTIIRFEASSLCLPYFERLLRLMRRLEPYRAAPFIRNMGYGSIAVVEKHD